MTSGTRRAVTAAALAVLVAAPAAAADWGLEPLMRQLAQTRSARADFVERKDVALLTEPLESSGTLLYVAPDRLEKHTLAPRRESLVLANDRLTYEGAAAGGRRILALDDYPVVRAFVESIRSTLAGDLATLRRHYRVDLQGNEADWRLTLVPLAPAMRDVVEAIRIAGGRGEVRAVEVIETSGDRSVMTITRAAP